MMKRIGMAATVALVCALSGIGEGAVPPEQIPLFKWRARVLRSADAPAASNASYAVTLNKVGGPTAGGQWGEWHRFDLEHAKAAVGPHSYPNDHIRGWPIVFRFSYGVKPPAEVEAELVFDEAPDKTIAMTGRLYGGQLGFLVWREADLPRAASMRDYNRKYWAVFDKVPLTAAERPALFPIADRYIHGDTDLDGLREGIETLTKGGFSAVMMGPDVRSRAILTNAGITRTSAAVYSPPGYAFDYSVKGQEEIDLFAREKAAAYTNAGFAREDMALYCLSDEPGWYYPSMLNALTNSADGLARFRDYLKAQGLKPGDVGASDWNTVFPLGRSGAKGLPSKRLFYWTMRFFPWDSARHFARVTRAMEEAFYTNMPILVNWNFFAGRCYVPGPVANNGAKTSPDAAMGGHDWLEFGRMRGCTMLWTEDWFGDQQAYQWSYYAARLRAGARLGGVRFGGYVIPRTAGSREDGILQKILAIVGHGGKGIKYFVFGPEYVFPGNCYSENVKVLPKMVEAHRMIGRAESLLWPGEKPFSPVGLLMPRSAQMWDAKDEAIPKSLSDATNTDLNRATVDYMAEVFNLYLALMHDNIPAEIVDEDDLTDAGLAPYKVLYVTEPNIPRDGQEALVRWTRAGGTLVTVCGAGSADRYDEPTDILAKGLGYGEKAPPRLLIGHLRNVPESAAVRPADDGEPLRVCGPVSEVTPGNGTVQATFADGRPAIVRQSVGRGVSVHFAWFPGLSYRRFQEGEADKLPVGWPAAIRKRITEPVRLAGVGTPVRADRPMIETPALVSEKGVAVTLLNWSGEPVERLRVSINVQGPIASVESVLRGVLPHQSEEAGVVEVTLPLQAADILMIRR